MRLSGPAIIFHAISIVLSLSGASAVHVKPGKRHAQHGGHSRKSASSRDAAARRVRTQQCVQEYADGLDSVHEGLGNNIRAHPLKPASVSDEPRILLASPGGTASTSFCEALKELGVSCFHNDAFFDLAPVVSAEHGLLWPQTYLNCPKWRGLPRKAEDKCLSLVRDFNYTAAMKPSHAWMDTPTAELFLDIFLAFPNAKVAFSDRPSDDWAQHRMTFMDALQPLPEPCGHFMFSNWPRFSAEDVARLYELHRKWVECLVPQDQYLKYSVWTDSKERLDNLMPELAKFLGVPESRSTLEDGTPKPFPRSNNTHEAAVPREQKLWNKYRNYLRTGFC